MLLAQSKYDWKNTLDTGNIDKRILLNKRAFNAEEKKARVDRLLSVAPLDNVDYLRDDEDVIMGDDEEVLHDDALKNEETALKQNVVMKDDETIRKDEPFQEESKEDDATDEDEDVFAGM